MRPAGVAAALAVLVSISAVAAFAALLCAPPPPSREGDVWRLRRAGKIYRFHATFRTEALFEASDALETLDLSAGRRDELLALRGRFLGLVRARSLEEVAADGDEWRRRLEGVGYIGGGGR